MSYWLLAVGNKGSLIGARPRAKAFDSGVLANGQEPKAKSPTPKHTARCAMLCDTRAVLLLLAALCLLPGCSLIGYGAQVFDSDRAKSVEARYTDLAGRRVAVMAAAPGDTFMYHPQAREAITKTVSRRIAENVKNVSLMNPEKIIDYQVANPFWYTLPYSRVMENLGVDRLVVIDLVDYRTHEEGNRHVYRGLISANVGVLEAEAPDPDHFAFRRQVRAVYPKDSKIGVVNADEQTIELATIKRFTAKAAGLFYQHKEAP